MRESDLSDEFSVLTEEDDPAGNSQADRRKNALTEAEDVAGAGNDIGIEKLHQVNDHKEHEDVERKCFFSAHGIGSPFPITLQLFSGLVYRRKNDISGNCSEQPLIPKTNPRVSARGLFLIGGGRPDSSVLSGYEYEKLSLSYWTSIG